MADYLQELRQSIDDRKKRAAILKPSARAAREKQYGMTDSGGGIAGAAVKPTAARTAQTTVIKPSAKAAQEQRYGIVDWKNTKPQTAAKTEAAPLVSARPEEKPEKQNWAKTVLDVADRGAGYGAQGISTAIDVAANALPIVEGWVFGVDKDATFTGQVLRPVTYLTGKFDDWVRATNANTQARIENDTRDSRAARVAADVGSGVVGALPSAVMAILSGGSSAVAQLGTQATGISGTVVNAANTMLHNPVVQYNFAASLGNEFNAAKASGASDMDAMTAATVSGLFNAIVESGGVEALPKQLRGTDLSTAQKVWRWLISLLAEGEEEVVQGVISEMTAKATYAANKPYFSTTDEYAVVNPGRMVREFGYGTAIGGITSAVPMASAKAVELWERSTRENGGRAQVQNATEVHRNKTVPGKKVGTKQNQTNSGIIPFSDQEATNLTSRKGIVNGHGMTFREFVNNVRSFGNTVRYYFGKVSDNLGAKIKAATKHDVSGFNIAIRSDEVVHAFNNHGNAAKEAKRGQLPVTPDVMERLPEVFDNPDEVVPLKDPDYAGREAFEIRKWVDGYMVAVIGIANGRHSVEVDSVRVINKKRPPTTVNATLNVSPDQTPETSSRQAFSSEVHTTSQTGKTTADSGYTHTPNLIIAEEVGVVNRGDSANGNNSAMGAVSSGNPSANDEEVYTEYIRQVREAQEKVRMEELKQAYLRNMARLEEAEREAELDAAFWKYWD